MSFDDLLQYGLGGAILIGREVSADHVQFYILHCVA